MCVGGMHAMQCRGWELGEVARVGMLVLQIGLVERGSVERSKGWCVVTGRPLAACQQPGSVRLTASSGSQA